MGAGMKLSDQLRTIAVAANGSIPKRPLGKTGLEVSCLGLGGESLIKIKNKHDEAIELIQAAYKMGINYFDTAASYENSEVRIGEALEKVRKKVIIASKVEARTKEEAWAQLEKSLTNLRTDYLDIWQIHHIDTAKEVEVILGPDGACSALLEARKQGLVRHIGITGHYDPYPLLDAIKRFKFDTILLAMNAADVHKRSFIKKVLPEANGQDMGVIAMKVCSRGRIFDPTHLNNMKDALEYVLTLPIATAIVGHDNIRQLTENVMIAQNFKPMDRSRQDELENLTKPYADLALFFRKGNEKFNPFWKPFGYKESK
jgi:aryl-alcohol dehydrogenase-like predicted oxidoreductase